MRKIKILSKEESQLVIDEVLRFKELVRGYENLLRAIGRLECYHFKVT